jgi:hypothetical protein
MKILLSLCLFFYCPIGICAVDFFYLTETGKDKIKISLEDLKAMPTYSFKTSTNYTTEEIFLGVKIYDLVEKYKIEGKLIRAFAWDDYSYSMPIDEMIQYNVILAYQKGGVDMDIKSFGPFAIIYPRDIYPELSQRDVNAKTVWQIRLLEIK